MGSLAYNIVILPSKELTEQAIALSDQLAKHGVHFTLRDGAFFPHLSVYMLQLKTGDLNTVQEELRKVAGQTPPLELSAINYAQAMQFLDIEYEKTSELSGLQRTVVSAINPLRDGMRAKDIERMEQASGLALENFKMYGWNTIGDLYRPHLTLTRFLDDKELASLALPQVEEFNGLFSELALFEMGDNGTCVRKIAKFELDLL